MQKPLRSPLDYCEQFFIVLAGVSLVLVVAAQGWQVTSRYFLGDPPSWTDPLSTTLMAHAAMIGAAVGVRHGSHFAFTSLADATPLPLKRLLKATANLAVIATGLLLFGYGVHLVVLDAATKMPGAPLSLALKYTPLVLGGVLITLFGCEALFARPKAEP
ncbi:MAG: TRAP transporter small permease [Caulobacterales bacterium]